MLHDENYKRLFAARLPAPAPGGDRGLLQPGEALARVRQRRTAQAPRRHRLAPAPGPAPCVSAAAGVPGAGRSPTRNDWPRSVTGWYAATPPPSSSPASIPPRGPDVSGPSCPGGSERVVPAAPASPRLPLAETGSPGVGSVALHPDRCTVALPCSATRSNPSVAEPRRLATCRRIRLTHYRDFKLIHSSATHHDAVRPAPELGP